MIQSVGATGVAGREPAEGFSIGGRAQTTSPTRSSSLRALCGSGWRRLTRPDRRSSSSQSTSSGCPQPVHRRFELRERLAPPSAASSRTGTGPSSRTTASASPSAQAPERRRSSSTASRDTFRLRPWRGGRPSRRCTACRSAAVAWASVTVAFERPALLHATADATDEPGRCGSPSRRRRGSSSNPVTLRASAGRRSAWAAPRSCARPHPTPSV